MRSPFQSERDAFHSVVLLILALVPVMLAATLGPTWLAVALLAVVIAGLAVRASQLHVRKLRGQVLPVKMAPAHLGTPAERRVLVVASDTLAEDALIGEVERLASLPDTHVFLLVPAPISRGARLTGAVDGALRQARAALDSALDRAGRMTPLAGDVSPASPLRAIEDAFTTFVPDEVIVATRWEATPSGLEPRLAGLVRERFAVPVRHLVFDPGSGAREPNEIVETGYRYRSGQAAAARFGRTALAGTAIIGALAISLVAFVHSSESKEAHAASQLAAEQAAATPKAAEVVAMSIVPEYKPGPEGEKHDAFTQTDFTLNPGRPQTLRIDNTDTVPHSITAPGAGVNIVIKPGTHTYTLLVSKPGRYLWFCIFPCDEWAMEHPGYMSGYINVT
jgi:plastocyanin